MLRHAMFLTGIRSNLKSPGHKLLRREKNPCIGDWRWRSTTLQMIEWKVSAAQWGEGEGLRIGWKAQWGAVDWCVRVAFELEKRVSSYQLLPPRVTRYWRIWRHASWPRIRGRHTASTHCIPHSSHLNTPHCALHWRALVSRAYCMAVEHIGHQHCGAVFTWVGCDLSPVTHISAHLPLLTVHSSQHVQQFTVRTTVHSLEHNKAEKVCTARCHLQDRTIYTDEYLTAWRAHTGKAQLSTFDILYILRFEWIFR